MRLRTVLTRPFKRHLARLAAVIGLGVSLGGVIRPPPVNGGEALYVPPINGGEALYVPPVNGAVRRDAGKARLKITFLHLSCFPSTLKMLILFRLSVFYFLGGVHGPVHRCNFSKSIEGAHSGASIPGSKSIV